MSVTASVVVNRVFFSIGMFPSSTQPHYDEYDDDQKHSMITISDANCIGQWDLDVVLTVDHQHITTIPLSYYNRDNDRESYWISF